MISAFDALFCVALAVLAGAMRLRGRIGAPLGADEGYLWYGVQRTLAGEWPHRDFKSYEPARYLWCACLLWLAGRRSLAALRIAVHAFYASCLACALLALRLQDLGLAECALLGILLVVWASPQHKLFEHGIALLACAAGGLLLAQPGPASALAAGAVVGLALTFGFNLFLYVGAACVVWLTALVLLHGVQAVPWLQAAAGAAVAASPMLLALVRSRGFRTAFVERRIATILRRGHSNLPLPVPLPWRKPAASAHPWVGARHLALSLLLPGLPLLCLVLGGLALVPGRLPQADAVLAAAILGLGFAHHAYARADASHLAQSATPAVLAGGTALCALPLAELWLLLAAGLSAWLWWPAQPERLVRQQPEAFAPMPREDGAVLLPRTHARWIAHLLALGVSDRVRLLALPALPWMYAALGLRAPVYDTFCVWPAHPAEQQRMLDEMRREAVDLVAIDDSALDAREELRFRHTHPQVWSVLLHDYERLPPPEPSSSLHLFRRRSVAPGASTNAFRSGAPSVG